MTTPPDAWRTALERLLNAPMLSAPQARFLFAGLGGAHALALETLWARLADTRGDRAADAAFLLESVLSAADRAWVMAHVPSDAPPRLRAWLRALYQGGLVHGRLKDEEAEIPVAPAELLTLYVEDVVRHVSRIPQPWQRARIAAEALVSDAPIPDGDGPAAVDLLAARLALPAAQLWAELLVHPWTRPAFRLAARAALGTPTQAAVPLLEQAEEVLLDGPLRDDARAALIVHRAATGGRGVHAAVSGPDSRGALVVVMSVSGVASQGVAVVAAPWMTDGYWKKADGRAVEGLHLWAAQHAQSHGGLYDVPPPLALALVRRLLPWLWEGAPTGKDAPPALPGLRDALDALAALAGVPMDPALPTPVAPAVWNVDVLEHPLLASMEIDGNDLAEATRRDLSKEMRARGRPKDTTLAHACRDLVTRKGVTARLRRALEHAAAVAHARDDAAAAAIEGLAAALVEPTSPEGTRALTALLNKTMGLDELAQAASAYPPPSSRDELRDDLLPGQAPRGAHVLALDLGAAALDAARASPRGLDGLDEERTQLLHVDAGALAARAVLGPPDGQPEDVRLQEAAKQAIRMHAESLPARQRRELAESWCTAWTELLTRACRGACHQQCLSHVQDEREAGAFALDHPRLNKPWP